MSTDGASFMVAGRRFHTRLPAAILSGSRMSKGNRGRFSGCNISFFMVCILLINADSYNVMN